MRLCHIVNEQPDCMYTCGVTIPTLAVFNYVRIIFLLCQYSFMYKLIFFLPIIDGNIVALEYKL